ncbi:MAG: hypothetical protein JNJ77_06740 [Planctomycetia bacterium]|nr:hypothetical protein [Planctomycetia bacterium]
MADDQRDVAALHVIQHEIAEGRIRVYRNALNQAYVYCDHPSFPGQNLPLFHRDFRGWLCHYVWSQKQLLLHEREVDRILEVLRGQSMETPVAKVCDQALLQLLVEDPLLALIVDFMEGKTEVEYSMTELLRSLKIHATEHGQLKRISSRFPGGANVLSGKLKDISPSLALFGITVTIRRSNGARVTLQPRLDDTCGESSTESSAPNHNKTKGLSPVDDRALRLQELALRKQKTSNPDSI